MGLLRLILLGFIIALGVWVWRRFNRCPSNTVQQPAAKTMVRCAHCHVHVANDRAVQQGQLWFCCKQHLAQGPKARD